MTPNRDFKGIWIPREIWLHPDLLPNDKIIWAEIQSLYNREKGGCYASNEYLSKFTNTTPRYVGEVISKLKKMGLIELVSFDGRIRIIKAITPPEDFSKEKEQEQISYAEKSHSSHAKKQHGRQEPQFLADTNCSSTYSSSSKNKDIKKEEESYAPPAHTISQKKPKKIKEQPVERADRVQTTPSQHKNLLDRCGGDAERVYKAYNELSAWKIGKGKGYGASDYLAVIKWVFDALDEKGEKSTRTGASDDWIAKVKKLYPERPNFIHGRDYFEVVIGPNSVIIKYDEHGFRERVIQGLRKIQLYNGDL